MVIYNCPKEQKKGRYKPMKKVAIALMIALLMFVMCVMFAHAEEEPDFYAKVGIIFRMDYEEDIVYVVDFFGEEWSFFGCEDWDVGDFVAAVMNTMGTELIYDDEIVSVTYNGYIKF